MVYKAGDMTLWFIEVRRVFDDSVARYVPVNADSQENAARAVLPLILEDERIGTIASRQFFEALKTTNPGEWLRRPNLPADSTAITGSGSKGPQDQDVQGITEPAQVRAEGPDQTSTAADLTDPIAAFLQGLGFDFGGTPGSYRDFQQSQGQLGTGTYAGQRARDFYFDKDPTTQGPQTAEAFGRDLALQSPGNPFGAMGSRALSNLGMLSNLGSQYIGGKPGTTGGPTDSLGQARMFFNPFNVGELDDRGIAAQLTAALQGAGVSPLYNRGPSSSDIQRLFTTFAGQNPNMAQAGMGLDQNFLSYAADQYGLSRFFDN